MGLKMIDTLSLMPVVCVSFGFWLHNKQEKIEAERARQPNLLGKGSSTGDKELDALFGITAPLAAPTPKPAA